MFIKPNYNRFSNFFWRKYSQFLLHKDFDTCNIVNEINISEQQSILLLGNHFSWYDGFIANYINHQVFHKQFHVLMLEEQLQKYSILRTAGAFSINRQSKTMLASLQFAAMLLDMPQNMLTLYPQGRIESAFVDVPTFEKGWFHLFKYKKNSPQIVFYTALFDFLSKKKPTLTIYLQAYPNDAPLTVEAVQDSFLKQYADARHKQGSLFC